MGMISSKVDFNFEMTSREILDYTEFMDELYKLYTLNL